MKDANKFRIGNRLIRPDGANAAAFVKKRSSGRRRALFDSESFDLSFGLKKF